MLSRVADNLYWMSRYLERAEHTARLLAVKLESMLEQSKEDADDVVAPGGHRALERRASAVLDDGRLRDHACAGARPVQHVLADFLAQARARQRAASARADLHRDVGPPEPALSEARAGDDAGRVGRFARVVLSRHRRTAAHAGGRHQFDHAARRVVAVHPARPLYRARAAREPAARSAFRRGAGRAADAAICSTGSCS